MRMPKTMATNTCSHKCPSRGRRVARDAAPETLSGIVGYPKRVHHMDQIRFSFKSDAEADRAW